MLPRKTFQIEKPWGLSVQIRKIVVQGPDWVWPYKSILFMDFLGRGPKNEAKVFNLKQNLGSSKTPPLWRPLFNRSPQNLFWFGIYAIVLRSPQKCTIVRSTPIWPLNNNFPSLCCFFKSKWIVPLNCRSNQIYARNCYQITVKLNPFLCPYNKVMNFLFVLIQFFKHKDVL